VFILLQAYIFDRKNINIVFNQQQSCKQMEAQYIWNHLKAFGNSVSVGKHLTDNFLDDTDGTVNFIPV
jgi:hypothetical protein